MAISPSPFDRVPKTRRGSRSPRIARILVIGVLIAGAIVFREQAADLFWRAAAPVLRGREALSGGEAARLRDELARADALLADRGLLYKENLDLKARLGRADAPEPGVVAAVLQSPPWTPYDTLLIDAGRAQGIAVGDYVSAGGATRIGKIIEVYAKSARVELLSAPGASYQALLGGALPLAVEGQGGGSMLALVPRGTPVEVGDTVSFPGVFGGVAASVSAIDEREGESFVSIYMHLPVNPAHLRFVEVSKP